MSIKDHFISVAVLATIACGTDAVDSANTDSPSSMDSSEVHARLASLSDDLSEGAQGDDVLAVQEYLRTYGYFPNEQLAKEYPAWRPILDHEPQWGTFDQTTADALRAMQAHLGLAQTAVVDEATRTLLRGHRCHIPEGMPESDPSNKFAPHSSRSKRELTWRLLNTDDVDQETSLRATRNAFNTWQAQTSLTFREESPSTVTDLIIAFVSIDGFSPPGSSGVWGLAALPTQGNYIFLDSDEPWTETFIRSVMLHEIGHSLGLHHSAFSGTVMYPFGNGSKITLELDDRIGISSLYDTWHVQPGDAIDIGVGAIPGLPTGPGPVWAIGTNHHGNGNFGIFRLNQNNWSWEEAPGNAVRIAVGPDFRPWVVNSFGQIFRRSGGAATSGDWQLWPGAANDIAVGGPNGGTPWVIGTDARGGGNFGIHRWNGSMWQDAPGSAVRIAVDTTGKPWVVNAAGEIYRRTQNSATSGDWVKLPGSANDIGIGPAGYPFIITSSPIGADFFVQVWNEQPCLNKDLSFGCFPAGDGDPGVVAPGMSEWRTLPVFGRAISVGSDGQPWVLNAAGDILMVER